MAMQAPELLADSGLPARPDMALVPEVPEELRAQGPLDTTPLEAEKQADERVDDSPMEHMPVDDITLEVGEEMQDLG